MTDGLWPCRSIWTLGASHFLTSKGGVNHVTSRRKGLDSGPPTQPSSVHTALHPASATVPRGRGLFSRNAAWRQHTIAA